MEREEVWDTFEQAQDACLDWVTADNRENAVYAVVVYAPLGDNDRYLVYKRQYVCHGGSYRLPRGAMYFVTKRHSHDWHRPNLDRAQFRKGEVVNYNQVPMMLNAYMKWVLEESPMKHTILEVQDAWFESNVEVPTEEMLMGIQMMRAVWENRPAIDLWYSLVKAGVDKSYAFYLSHSLSANWQGDEYLINFLTFGGDHSVLCTRSMSQAAARRFITTGLGTDEATSKEPYAQHPALNSGSHRYWGPCESGFFKDIYLEGFPYDTAGYVEDWEGGHDSPCCSTIEKATELMVEFCQREDKLALVGLA